MRRAVPHWLRRRLIPFECELESRAVDFCRNQAGRLLDAAGGSGTYANNAIGLDLNRSALLLRSGGPCICADVHDLPLRSHCLDTVCCCAALHHFRDPIRALKELRRCLRPGGRLFLTVPDRFPSTDQSDDYRRFSRAEICRLLEVNGWQLDSCRPIGGRCWVFSRHLLERLFAWLNPRQLPLFLACSPVIGLAVPLACYYLDREEGEETLGWEVVAVQEVSRRGAETQSEAEEGQGTLSLPVSGFRSPVSDSELTTDN